MKNKSVVFRQLINNKWIKVRNSTKLKKGYKIKINNLDNVLDT